MRYACVCDCLKGEHLPHCLSAAIIACILAAINMHLLHPVAGVGAAAAAAAPAQNKFTNHQQYYVHAARAARLNGWKRGNSSRGAVGSSSLTGFDCGSETCKAGT